VSWVTLTVRLATLLGGLVNEVPNQTGLRLLPTPAYYHSAQLRMATWKGEVD
jgi:hypothetical protein